jgi:type IV pilus assembly protein PilC
MARQVPSRFAVPSAALVARSPADIASYARERFERDRSDRAWDRVRRWRQLRPYDVFPSLFGVKKSELAMFSRQLATFVRAGIPLTQAIAILRRETRSGRMRDALAAIEADLVRGTSVSDAFSRFPDIFSELYLNLVRSAELTGTLDAVLKRLDVQLTREDRAQREIRSAMSYPLVILLMAVGSIAVMVIYVLPRFAVLLAEFHAELPLTTQILLKTAQFTTQNALLLALGLGAIVAGLIGSQNLERGRRVRDGLLLRLPVVGGLVRYASVARFCRTLGVMLEAGVPVARSLDIVVNSVSNRVLATRLQPIKGAMLAGEGFAGPLSLTGVFPPTVIQMVRVGEETGALERFLADAADFYENELEYRLQNAIQLLEPALLISVGLVIGFVAISLVSAIYSLTAAIR